MQRVTRQFQKVLPRHADESQVGALIHDFTEADKMLDRLIAAFKAYRDAWADILRTQYMISNEFQTIYSPIVGTGSEGYDRHRPAITPEVTMRRAAKLNSAYIELKTDVMDEVTMMEAKLIRPALDAKGSVQPMKKVIKRREDKKLDYDRYKGRVDSLAKKAARTDRENAAMAKHEVDLERATSEYNTADDHMKAVLPGITAAVYALLPHLLAVQVLTQNTLLGQLYTVLHTYCQEEKLPTPPPSMEAIVRDWDANFRPLRNEVEGGLQVLVNGKAVHQPMQTGERGSTLTGLNIRNNVISGGRHATTFIQARKPGASSPGEKPAEGGSGSTLTGLNIRSNVMSGGRRANSYIQEKRAGPPTPGEKPSTSSPTNEEDSGPPAYNTSQKPRMGSFRDAAHPSSPLSPPAADRDSEHTGPPAYNTASKPRIGSGSIPFRNSALASSSQYPDAAQASRPLISSGSHSPYNEDPHEHVVATPSPTYHTPPAANPWAADLPLSLSRQSTNNGDYFARDPVTTASSAFGSSTPGGYLGKKKPPPPPPMKAKRPDQGFYVTALYDYAPQSQHDLEFREGDKIKVLKKTDSTDDWWEGEVRGKTGSFPANYVR
ncbi:hypothetical protein B0A49_12201 [Cryomyces minteri]|uniref:SH3 domain-containing protein n=1 Tax=Cryomyces minteri TaxID=331657 RepID=A0A4U0VNA1_9PEZI|nr:hypothetical protein B0A49_12201 [Cryomyces minteri]